jgi:hypothetical protein
MRHSCAGAGGASRLGRGVGVGDEIRVYACGHEDCESDIQNSGGHLGAPFAVSIFIRAAAETSGQSLYSSEWRAHPWRLAGKLRFRSAGTSL